MTNRKELLDEALLRAGRIELHIRIALPDFSGRRQIFRIHTENLRANAMLKDINIDQLAERTKNFSGSEIEAVVRKAIAVKSYEMLSDNLTDFIITNDDLLAAIDKINPMFSFTNSALPENYRAKLDPPAKHALIYGPEKSGKTTLLNDWASRQKDKYVVSFV